MTLEPPPSVAAAPEIDRRRVLQLIDEQRTISLAHTDEHVKRYLDAFDAFARSLNG